MSYDGTRRKFLAASGMSFLAAMTPKSIAVQSDHGFRSLFNGKNLDGWKAHPREAGQTSVGKWTVQDGMIVGTQDPPRVGSYLVTEETFADFEIQLDAWPDWPADTGVYVRTNAQGNTGIQILIDYRPGGCIGGFYGNKLGQFHASKYAFSAVQDKDGRILRLKPEEVARPPKNFNHYVDLDYAAPVEEFLKTWKLNTWNTFRIRSEGAIPKLTTWINGVKIAALDLSKVQPPAFDATRALELIGRSGHIALEVHSNGPKDWLGNDRWAPGNVCRWRNISIRTL